MSTNPTPKLNKQQAATFYRGVLAEAEDAQEPDDLLAQAARGVREREARRREEAFDRALGEGRR